MSEDESYLYLNEGGFVPGMYRSHFQPYHEPDGDGDADSEIPLSDREPTLVGDVGGDYPDEA